MRRLLAASGLLALAASGLLALAACATPAPAARAPAPRAAPPAAGAEPPVWRYRAVAGEGARELAIEAWLPAGELPDLELDDGAAPFLDHLELERAGRFTPLALARLASRPAPFDREPGDEPVCRLPACPAEGCHLRYRFRLAAAARDLDEPGVAAAYGDTFLAPPSAWLLHPDPAPDAQPYRLEVETPPGVTFATGVLDLPGGAHGAEVADLIRAPYSAFGPLRMRTIDLDGGALEVAIVPGALALPEDDALAALGASARAVRAYYGRAPLARTLALLLPGGGDSLGYCRALGNGGASILVPIGRRITREGLAGNWQMTHELLHTAFPNLDHRHAWLEEGMATYVEPIARARAGLIPAEQVWAQLVRRLPLGLPQPGDQGLDRTPTWGRTYWGGALFCFLADLAIRERTSGRRSLDDALRAVLAAGGNVAHRWDLAQVLETGDRATGVPVLAELHARMGEAPAPVDLDAVWKRLGVAMNGEQLVLDDTAPLAALRRAITAP